MRRRALGGVLSALLLTIALGPVVLPGPSAAAADDSIEQYAAWNPPPGTGQWRSLGGGHLSADLLGPCPVGITRVWQDAAGREVDINLVDCDTAAKANDWVNFIWAIPADGRLRTPDAFPPALGSGVELDSLIARQGILRQWSQGTYAFGFDIVHCGQATSCTRDSAAIALSLSALFPSINRLQEPPNLLAGALRGWTPGAGWRLTSSTATTAPCRGVIESTWVDRTRRLSVIDGTCGGSGLPQISARLSRASGANPVSAWVPIGSGSNWATLERGANRYADATESWSRAGHLLIVDTQCPHVSDSACGQQTQSTVDALDARFAGRAAPLQQVAAGLWPAALVVAVVVALAVASRVRTGGWAAVSGPTFTAVDDDVRRARLRRGINRLVVLLAWLVGFLAWSWLVAVAGVPPGVDVPVSLLAPTVLAVLAAQLLQRVRPATRFLLPVRVPGPADRGARAGRAAQIAARAILTASLAMYGLIVVVVVLDLRTPLFTVIDHDQSALRSANPLDLIVGRTSAVVTALNGSDVNVLVVKLLLLASVLLIGPITVALLLDRLGRRLARRDLEQTLKADPRPHFLYLRGFDEDRLRLGEVAGRRGLLEAVAPVSRPRFEELLVEQLGHFGPTVAIAAGRQRLQDLGAAKMSFDDDRWRQAVERFADGARAIVMSVTPDQVHEGLRWEIEFLSARWPDLRIVLVLAPWRRHDLVRRWNTWLGAATPLQPFGAIDVDRVPSGVQVLTWSPAVGWRAWGARRRWDWTYSASLYGALATLDDGAVDAT